MTTPERWRSELDVAPWRQAGAPMLPLIGGDRSEWSPVGHPPPVLGRGRRTAIAGLPFAERSSELRDPAVRAAVLVEADETSTAPGGESPGPATARSLDDCPSGDDPDYDRRPIAASDGRADARAEPRRSATTCCSRTVHDADTRSTTTPPGTTRRCTSTSATVTRCSGSPTVAPTGRHLRRVDVDVSCSRTGCGTEAVDQRPTVGRAVRRLTSQHRRPVRAVRPRPDRRWRRAADLNVIDHAALRCRRRARSTTCRPAGRA